LKRIDTHTHPKISKHLTFNPDSVTRMARMARRLGLDGIALTEHFHAASSGKRGSPSSPARRSTSGRALT